MYPTTQDRKLVTGPKAKLAGLSTMALLAVLVSCKGCPPTGTGITVPGSDSTPPGLTLGFGLEGSSTASGSVSAGGATQTVTLAQKTGKLSLLATASDQESGILSVGIFMEGDIVRCPAHQPCTGNPNHGLWSTPNFVLTNPKVNPGSSGALSSSILAESVDLSTLITAAPTNTGDSVTTTIWLMATSQNQLNGTSNTAEGKVVFTETK